MGGGVETGSSYPVKFVDYALVARLSSIALRSESPSDAIQSVNVDGIKLLGE